MGLMTGLISLSQGSSLQVLKSSVSANHTLASPALQGDADLCMVLGRTVGKYSGGGSPGDVYDWSVTKSTGEEIFAISGGEQFETIQVVFSEVGEYTVFLKVRRGTDSNFYQNRMQVRIQRGPEKLALRPDYLLCGNNPALLTALDPNTADFEDYSITWRDIDKKVLGYGNELSAYTSGIYWAEIYLKNADGGQTCTINASTYVGPAIDFDIVLSASKICEGRKINLSTDTPLSGEWFIQKTSGGKRRSLGKGFGMELESTGLEGPGFYEVSFNVPSKDFPDCTSERKAVFELAPAPQLDIQILEQPAACFNVTGSFQVQATSDLESIAIPELDFYKNGVSSGEIFTFQDLKAKAYAVQLVQNGCTTHKLIELNSKDWVGTSLQNQSGVTLSQADETCVAQGVIPGRVFVGFDDPITKGEYRILSPSDGVVRTGRIPDSGMLEVELNSGNYLLEVTVDDCTYPMHRLTILEQPQVQVSVPTNIRVCETYGFVPDASDDLLLTLTFPDGSVQTAETGDGFTLTEAGNYSLLAEPLAIGSTLCPKQTDFTVTLLTPFSFAPLLIEENCFEPIRYRAVLQGIRRDEVNIRWMDSNGTIVGRSQEFYPPTTGVFYLSVLPVGSGFCPAVPLAFEVVEPITQVPMDLTVTELCTGPEEVLITLSTMPEEVARTEWIFYDQSATRQDLVDYGRQFEIQVNRTGTYEVVAYNKLGCEIGRNLLPVTITPFYSLLDLEEQYPVCFLTNSIPPIDAGVYAAYAWYFEGEQVSTERFYKPDQLGDYHLMVTTAGGCILEESFSTNEVCNFQSVYPNAMVLGNPEKDFRVLTSTDITEAELFILNRQGQLIHYAITRDIPEGNPVLRWDGKLNGSEVPSGNYALQLILRNPLYGVEEKQTGTLLILK